MDGEEVNVTKNIWVWHADRYSEIKFRFPGRSSECRFHSETSNRFFPLPGLSGTSSTECTSETFAILFFTRARGFNVGPFRMDDGRKLGSLAGLLDPPGTYECRRIAREKKAADHLPLRNRRGYVYRRKTDEAGSRVGTHLWSSAFPWMEEIAGKRSVNDTDVR